MTSHDDQARRDELYRDPYPLYDRARRAEGLTHVPDFDEWLVPRDRNVREVPCRPTGSAQSLASSAAWPAALSCRVVWS
ncbi:hypothetical protein [Streptomyces sp. NBC_00122]|uniref:hypothetical protein n=1 Tax=Streptomyces sp. NBC_00122 TaxID=2903623 RepID=UPI00386FF8D0